MQGFGTFRAVARLSNHVRLLLVLALLAVPMPDRGKTAEPPPSLAYHATLLNGTIVGSAFMIAEGLAVTNSHVVQGRRPGDTVTLTTNGQARVKARILAISRRIDLAILSVRSDDMPVPRLRQTSGKRGEQVFALGVTAYRGGAGRKQIVRGVVTSKPRSLAPFGRGVIVKMPLVKKGFSGGPVFGSRGAVVGMVTALRDRPHASGSTREAFVLTTDVIYAELRRLSLQ